MNRKTIYFVGVLLVLCCFTLVHPAFAQPTVGVSVGNTFKYQFAAYYSTTNPLPKVPAQWIEYNKTQWIQFTITGVSNLTVSYFALAHFVNGSETTSQNYENLGTGKGGFPMIPANLAKNDAIYSDLTDSPVVSDVLNRTYLHSQRTECRVLWSGAGEVQFILDAYFDQKTGMPVQLRLGSPIASPEGVETTGVFEYNLIESTVWTVPEFSTVFVLPLIAAVTLAGALLYKASRRVGHGTPASLRIRNHTAATLTTPNRIRCSLALVG